MVKQKRDVSELKRVIREIKKDIAVSIYYDKDAKIIDRRIEELKLLTEECDKF